MHPWMIEKVAEQRVSDLRRAASPRRAPGDAGRASVWLGHRLIGAGCRLARTDVIGHAAR